MGNARVMEQTMRVTRNGRKLYCHCLGIVILPPMKLPYMYDKRTTTNQFSVIRNGERDRERV